MKRRLIQIGVGGWGATWLEKAVSSPSWELAGCVDLNEEALEAARLTHGISREQCFSSVAEAAEATRADGALVVVERATRSGPLDWPPGFSAGKSRRYGEATFWYGWYGSGALEE